MCKKSHLSSSNLLCIGWWYCCHNVGENNCTLEKKKDKLLNQRNEKLSRQMLLTTYNSKFYTFTGLTLSCPEWSSILSGRLSWSTSRPQDANCEAWAFPWYSKLWHVKHILAEFNPFGAYRSQYSGACHSNRSILNEILVICWKKIQGSDGVK